MFTDVVTGNFAGLLFIGDPHVSSVRPGRRTDDYLSSVLGKLDEAARIANERNLLPVITGDLIHRNNESSVKLCHRLMKVLRRFNTVPLDVEGNHGKELTTLSEGDVELLLEEAGVLRVVSAPQMMADVMVGGRRVQLFSCPYGHELPEDLSELGATQDATRVLVTHHDLAFESAYPEALPLVEVRNCDVAVNGHMHKTAPSVQVGMTLWHCPGNIEPLSRDVRDHRPAVWEFSADDARSLTPHYLAHNADCFNLEGYIVPAAGALESVHALPGMSLSSPAMATPEFLVELQRQDALDVDRTEDATVLEEDVAAVLESSGAPEAVQALMQALVGRVKLKAAA